MFLKKIKTGVSFITALINYRLLVCRKKAIEAQLRGLNAKTYSAKQELSRAKEKFYL